MRARRAGGCGRASRARPACAAARALPARARRGRAALVTLGSFSLADVRGARRRATRRACSSTERAGRVRVIVDGVRAGDAVPRPDRDHARRRAGARAALDRVRARLRDVGPLLRLPDRAVAGRRDPDLGVPALGGRPERRRPGERAPAAGDPAPRGVQPQRRPAAVRAGRQAVARRPATAAAATTSTATRRTRPRCSASCCGSTRRRGRRRSARRTACATRGASRSTARRADRDRRRRPERCTRRSTSASPPTTAGRAARARTPTSPTRAATASRPPTRCSRRPHTGDGFCAIVGGYVVRDPGLPTLRRPLHLRRQLRTALRSVDLANPAGDAPSALSVAGAELVRRGRLRPHPRRLAHRPGLAPGRRRATPCGDPTPTTHADPDGTARRRRPRATRRRRQPRRRRPRTQRRRRPRPRPRTATPTRPPRRRRRPPRPPRDARTADRDAPRDATATATATPRPRRPHRAPAARRPSRLRPTARRSLRRRACGTLGHRLASLGRRGYLSVALRADEPCRATVSARIAGVSTFRTRRSTARGRRARRHGAASAALARSAATLQDPAAQVGRRCHASVNARRLRTIAALARRVTAAIRETAVNQKRPRH